MSEKDHIQFVTGRLAEPALRSLLDRLAADVGFEYTVQVLPITVAALMTPSWIAKRLEVDPLAKQIILPGFCNGDLTPITAKTTVPVAVGPKDFRDLPQYFGNALLPPTEYGSYQTEIIAEINHAPRFSFDEILRMANELRASGADVIDLGCQPGETWQGVGGTIRALRDQDIRVSIDSFNEREVAAAVEAGAELVLSVNSSNRQAARNWGCEVVAIPDDPAQLHTLDETAAYLTDAKVPFRLDPILEPIGYGLGASLRRYAVVRDRYPQVPMMMGIGNVTELTDVDSAGMNVLLLALCEEWQIQSVLTTQVINWARTSVRECDLARRLVHHAIKYHTLPKHLEPGLVMLRDVRTLELGESDLAQLAASIRDSNYRIVAERGELHLIAGGLHLQDEDPFDLFAALLRTSPKNLDPSHAFYLGYELCKARTALTLGKQYQQDQALTWGFLTREERHH